jgi:hypothetical protein
MQLRFLSPLTLSTLALLGCSAGVSTGTGGSGGTSSQQGSTTGSTGTGFGGAGSGSTGSFGSGGSCAYQCSPDLHQVLCGNMPTATCSGAEGCDLKTASCKNACQAAVDNHLSVGCDYYATDMDSFSPNACFAAFVANTWNTPVHIQADFNGQTIDLGQFAKIPSGSGASLTYGAYDPVAGLAPGQVAILFLAGGTGGFGGVSCPVPSAVPTGGQVNGTGLGHSFHITTDVPVVSYQINPYGGGSAAVTAASLLLPTSVWDLNYVAVNISPYDIGLPSLNIVARDDNTTVTLLPKAAVQGGGGVSPMSANTPSQIVLQHGQQVQISQTAELTGSVVSSDKPVGFMAGQTCMRYPSGVTYCDHGEQMIPPVKALGSEYVGVMYRPRTQLEASNGTFYKLIGAVDGTTLTYSSNVGGPATLSQGQVVEFKTKDPFVVKSQDDSHPFLLMTYMPSSGYVGDGYGDPDLVVSVPPAQYLSRYVFFADPTYPETDLVVVRAKDQNGMFHDVNLDCAGNLTGWQPIGDYEWTRIDLSTGNFTPVGSCSTGAHEMKSDGRFGLWVWGWGTPETSNFTANVSYGYPGGMNALPINTVVVPPIPN